MQKHCELRYVFFFFLNSPTGPANWLQRPSSVLPASTHIIGQLFVIVNQSWADRLRELSIITQIRVGRDLVAGAGVARRAAPEPET